MVKRSCQRWIIKAVVVAHLVERSLPIPEVCSSNPVIGKKILNIYCQLYGKYENKEKEAGNGPLFKKYNTAIFSPNL